jgi:hypothetical protein
MSSALSLPSGRNLRKNRTSPVALLTLEALRVCLKLRLEDLQVVKVHRNELFLHEI